MSMIKKILAAVGVVFILGLAYVTYGIFINPKSPKGSVTFKNDQLELTVDYYRPYKKDRLIFGPAAASALVPYDTYWRLGANFATVFETQTAIAFHGRQLAPGAYRMYAIPYADHWIVALNSEAGAFGYNPPDYANDVMRVNVPVQQKDQSVEQFTIDFVEDSTGVALRMRWDTTAVLIGIQ